MLQFGAASCRAVSVCGGSGRQSAPFAPFAPKAGLWTGVRGRGYRATPLSRPLRSSCNWVVLTPVIPGTFMAILRAW